MILGGLLALGGVAVPLIEPAVLASVLVLGVCVALGTSVPPSAVLVLPGLFAICHGYAHVAEMTPGASPAAYAAGFLLATITLISIGITIGALGRRFAPMVLTRFTGAGIATCGVLLCAHVL